jgi:HlyD family secretion protein
MFKSGSIGFVLGSLVLLAALAAGGWYFFAARQAEPVRYLTTAVGRADLTQSVTATGDLQPVTLVEVSSQISGLVSDLLVDYNSTVRAGQVLARIDPASYESRLRQSRAELANSQASHDLVRLNADRIESLFARNLVSQQELDQARAQVAQARAQLELRLAAVENAEVDLARCEIVSPIDGMVIDRPIEIGKTVAASLNAPVLFTIANDLARMQIRADVAEADIGQIAEGQRVNFTVDAYPGQTFHGEVAQIRNAPTVQSNVVIYPVIIAVSNPGQRLKPGMTANVSIIIADRANALFVPNAALRVRVPPGVRVVTPTAAPDAVAGELPVADRETVRELMAAAGFTPGAGGMTPEVAARLQELARERGVRLPERSGRGPGGGNRESGATGRPVPRTVYRLADTGSGQHLQAITIQTGISDGSRTEVISGLPDDAEVVTTIIAPVSPAATSNPFGGSRRF